MRKLCALALTTLVLLSCSPPPFDLALSLSAQAAARMTLLGQVGPMYNISSDQGVSDEMFIPEKDGAGGINLQAGFLTWTYQSGPRNLAAVIWDGSQGAYVRYGSIQSTPAPSPDQYPPFLVQAVKSFHNIEIFQFDDINPGNNSYAVFAGDPPTNQFPFGAPMPTLLHSLVDDFPINGVMKLVIGVTTYPDVNPTLDRTYWLFQETGTNDYLEAVFDNSQSVLTNIRAVRSTVPYDLSINNAPNGFLPDLMKRVLYYFDPVSARSYACWWDTTTSPNRWRTWVWISAIPTTAELTNVTHRIDALLTTGNLFSTEGEVGRIYDQDGALLSHFPLGNLKLVGEMYIGGVATVLFSQALRYNNELHFNVYSIPTSQLTTLGS